MTTNKWPIAILCGVILLVFAYSFWINGQKSPDDGGPVAISQ
jgi:hypothetical protein